MATLDRLLATLSNVYDQTPDPFLALRLSYAGGMQWTIANDTLSTTTQGGVGGPLSIDLTQVTSLSSLASFLASQPGYSVLYLDGTVLNTLSPLLLVPAGPTDILTSNGDHLFGAVNLTWLYLAAVGAELAFAQEQIEAAPAEMATTSADGEWLDLLGSYYAVPRQVNELDLQYAPRIPANVILPRQNNVAIANALQAATGQPASCTDAVGYGSPQPNFSGSISFNGAPHFYNATAALVYNLFDISIGYQLLGGLPPTAYLAAIRTQVDLLRAAGTHLRNLTLGPSLLGDSLTPPTDAETQAWTVRSLLGAAATSANSGAGTLNSDFIANPASANHGSGALVTHINLVGAGASANTGNAVPTGAW